LKTTAVIGYPLAHSITPSMYAPTFAAMGLEVQCEKWVTATGELAACIERLREQETLGANVTVPHKEAVIPLLDELDQSARVIGAVNCIVRQESGALKGYNTDKYGFIRSLREAGFEPSGRSAVVLGAGGAARAVAFGLNEAGITTLTIANRTRERAEAVASDLEATGELVAVVDWQGGALAAACRLADLLVNCTPMGTAHTDMERDCPLSVDHVSHGAFAYDLVYNPPLTPFLAMAAQAGANTVQGLEMLIYQGAESIRLWTGREPPIEVMRAAARQALVA
jgi:shikimate dehydrogenase